jgi:hypothetical protein
MEQRRKMFDTVDSRVDWATAELLAFGTMVCHHERPDLVVPGPPTVPHFHVRLSGQVTLLRASALTLVSGKGNRAS